MSTRADAVAWLVEHGPATRSELAAGLGCSYKQACRYADDIEDALVVDVRDGNESEGYYAMTHDEIAAELGMTRQNVALIEARALRKLRFALARAGIRREDV